jgi:hypothetical protein
MGKVDIVMQYQDVTSEEISPKEERFLETKMRSS